MKEQLREFLKDTIRQKVDFSRTEQNLGYPPPPVQKPLPAGAKIFPLPRREEWKTIGSLSVSEAIAHGLAYVSEDRKKYGLNLIEDVKHGFVAVE